MSDHVDGPRSIGEPAADVTDLFAFTSPENPARTVLAMCVFPSAGENAIFSNVIDHSIVVRRVTVAGVGNAAKFQPADDEIRFSFRFEVLKRDAAGKVIQRGVCTLPDGRELSLTVNDEKGASTPEGDVRVFAGLRSDPFYLAWIVAELKKVPNLLQHDNVLCIVVELDTRRVLDPAKGSLFGVIAETVPDPATARPSSDIQSRASTGSDAPSRRTYGSTIPRWREQTICATCGISRRRSRSRRRCSRCSCSA